jgi:phospholipid-binding lipoprotein MlaA
MNLPVKGFRRLAAFACTGLLLGGCATTGTRNPADPFEPVNRDAYRMNDTIDRAALKPVATAYHDHTPTWLQAGVGHFFTNLGYPWTIVNQLLQGKLVAAGQDTARFVINSTLGWGGIFDVASGANLPEHEEDLGQTLGKWGVPPGPYLMVPLLGPATVRDLPSVVGERFVTPLYWFNTGNAKWGSLVVSAVDKRARLLSLDPALDRVFDKYAFIRDAYLQRRQFQVYDGNPPAEPVDEEMQRLIDEANKDEPLAK